MNVQVVSDQKLLNCYLSGDRNAISQLIERHSRRVRDYIQMMVKDGDVADDIFQETFIKAVRVIDEGRYTDNGRFLSWILRIAHNQVIDHFRAQRQNKSVSEAEAGYDVLGTLDEDDIGAIRAAHNSLRPTKPKKKEEAETKELFAFYEQSLF